MTMSYDNETVSHGVAPDPLELMLFENCPQRARDAINYGVSIFIVDWESKGKGQRQNGYDTEINPGSLADLKNIADIQEATVWCRLNRLGPWTAGEVAAALDAGVKGLFLPMVTSLYEVDCFFNFVDERCLTGILIETVEAVAIAKDLSLIPLDRIFFGLNDYAISRKDRFLFKAVWDGTVERVRKELEDDAKFGFGGVTFVDGGAPIPSRHLINEMARLKCSFSFLRRSFKRDIQQQDPEDVVRGIHHYWDKQARRAPNEIQRDHHLLMNILEPLCI